MRFWTAAALACLAAPLLFAARLTPPTPTPTPAPTPHVDVPWIVDCTDDLRINGYMVLGVCVPGEEAYEASRFSNPGYFSGAMSSYGEGVMERVEKSRGMNLEGYAGGVALMGCNDIGKTAYIRRPGRGDWSGPFLVVDCSGRYGIYLNAVVRQLAVEVDYETAQRFGASTLPWVDVHVQGNSGGFAGMSLANWYVKNVLAFNWSPALAVPGPQPSLTAPPLPLPTPTSTPQPTALPVPSVPATQPEAAVSFAEVMFWLLVAHALGDFVFQSDKMGWYKRPMQGDPTWPLWLSAHALANGGLVGLATGYWQLGLAETVAHWLIDSVRSQRLIAMSLDQSLHLLCKVAWAAIVIGWLR